MCDRVGVMARGRLVAEGPPGTLRGTADRVRIEVDDAAAARACSPGGSRRLGAHGDGARPGRACCGVTLADGVDRGRVNAALVAAGIARARARARARHARGRLPLARGGRRCSALSSAKALRRWRTWLLAAALAGIPILIVVALKLSPPPPGHAARTPRRSCCRSVGTACSRRSRASRVVQPFFLPLAIGLFAGDAIAGEAQRRHPPLPAGPPGRAGRGWSLSKYAAAMTLIARCWCSSRSRAWSPAASCSGCTRCPRCAAPRSRWVSPRCGCSRGCLHAPRGLGDRGARLCISTLTDSGPGATVATIIVAIASQILDQIPSLHAIHPFLPTHGWLGFTGLFRFPVDWDADAAPGSRSALAYTVVFLGAAVYRFSRRDIAG